MPAPLLLAVAALAAPSVEITDVDRPDRLVADGSTFTLTARGRALPAGATLEVTGTSATYPRARVFRVRERTARTFEIAPAATAAYRVRAVADGDVVAESEPVTVPAFPTVALTSRRLGGGLEVRARATLNRLTPRPGSATEATFYYRLDGDRVYKSLATEPLTDKGCCTRRAAHAIYDTTLLAGIKTFRVCFAGRLFVGAGDVQRCPETLRP